MPNFHLEIEKILEELAINEIELKKDILKDIVLKKYLPTQQIISTSSQSKSVYMMVSGSAKALLYSEDGNEVWFSNFSKGQIFGEMAVLSNSGRSADICAISNVVAIKFSESKFLYLLNRYGNFSVFVMRQIIQRFRMTSDRLFELSALTVKGRIVAEIKRLSYLTDEKLIQVDNAPSITGMAKSINSSRETVSKALSELEDSGFLKRDRKLKKMWLNYPISITPNNSPLFEK